jgi:hypothetical protein
MLTNITDKNTFHTILNQLSKGKRPGPDGIPNELLMCLPLPVKNAIHDLLCLMWMTGHTPDTWKHSITILLQKPGHTEDEHLDLASYRPIALANTIYKLWT